MGSVDLGRPFSRSMSGAAMGNSLLTAFFPKLFIDPSRSLSAATVDAPAETASPRCNPAGSRSSSSASSVSGPIDIDIDVFQLLRYRKYNFIRVTRNFMVMNSI
jgi:hypothetical protein